MARSGFSRSSVSSYHGSLLGSTRDSRSSMRLRVFISRCRTSPRITRYGWNPGWSCARRNVAVSAVARCVRRLRRSRVGSDRPWDAAPRSVVGRAPTSSIDSRVRSHLEPALDVAPVMGVSYPLPPFSVTSTLLASLSSKSHSEPPSMSWPGRMPGTSGMPSTPSPWKVSGRTPITMPSGSFLLSDCLSDTRCARSEPLRMTSGLVRPPSASADAVEVPGEPPLACAAAALSRTAWLAVMRSWCSRMMRLARRQTSVEHDDMDSSKRSASTSRRYMSDAIQRARHTTCCVILDVTLGLPSRSPPIQEPKRKGCADSGRSRPVAFLSAALSRRRYCGTAAHSDCSTMCSPPRASSTGEGFCRLSSSVCHSPVTSRTRSSSTASCSSAVRSLLSFCCSSAAMRVCLYCSVRRLTCVGCAVSTTSTHWVVTASYRRSGVTPSAMSLENRSSHDLVFLRCSARLRRSLWCSSAMLLRFR
mmetsp:Transcript_31582/g.80543  ORF Transcript_31582/g.80543 Transcript_31582/m.80543 type:complete len:475 (+) Transcript_31582:2571-3995(+)